MKTAFWVAVRCALVGSCLFAGSALAEKTEAEKEAACEELVERLDDADDHYFAYCPDCAVEAEPCLKVKAEEMEKAARAARAKEGGTKPTEAADGSAKQLQIAPKVGPKELQEAAKKMRGHYNQARKYAQQRSKCTLFCITGMIDVRSPIPSVTSPHLLPSLGPVTTLDAFDAVALLSPLVDFQGARWTPARYTLQGPSLGARAALSWTFDVEAKHELSIGAAITGGGQDFVEQGRHFVLDRGADLPSLLGQDALGLLQEGADILGRVAQVGPALDASYTWDRTMTVGATLGLASRLPSGESFFYLGAYMAYPIADLVFYD